ncbi:MAG: hypothetical protein PHH13_03510 [Candidatus Peribacteraceae bacterium]|nr:hypothetical protein [Candidatus Peribacteraceae bacterium]
MRQSTAASLASLTIALLLPVITLAVAPSPVTGLTAESRDGKVIVSWQAQPNENVALYRVYFSSQSILENRGLYDDFETTAGPVTSYVIENPPNVPTLYISVLGVSSSGEDANTFVEEVSVSIAPKTAPEPTPAVQPPIPTPTPNAPTPPSEPTPPVEQPLAPQRNATVSIVSLQVVSATGVLLQFSDPITVEPTRAPEAFFIVDASGAQLPIVRIAIEGSTILVVTDTQERGQKYEMRVTEPAFNIEGIPLDPVRRAVVFDGSPSGRDPIPAVLQDPNAGMPLVGIGNFVMHTVQQGNGLYTITATWDIVGNPQELGYYIVEQTRDEGITFGGTQTLPAGIPGMQLSDVTPGSFGIVVTPVKTDGTKLPSASQMVLLEGKASATSQSPVAGVSAPRSPATDRLSTTGFGVAALAFAAAGATAGWRRTKKNQHEG